MTRPPASRRGDLTPREVALETAFAAHAAGVAALAARLLRDAEAGRDVCQETFVRFDERMDEVRGDPGPWLRAVASNLALDRLRRRRRDARALDALARRAREAEAGAGPGAGGPPDPVLAQERRERVLGALADLPDRQREVVALRVLEGETFPTVARALGISEGSAKVHLRRAVERLRGLLAPLLGLEARVPVERGGRGEEGHP